MQSLSFKLFTDFNAGGTTTRTCLPSRLTCGVADLEVGSRRLGLNCRDYPQKYSRIVACASGAESASSSSSKSSFLSRSQSYALLKQQMEIAAKCEDYEEAVKLRDSLKSFEEEELILHFRRLLREAVADERMQPGTAMSYKKLHHTVS